MDIGDGASDTVTITASVDSNIIPTGTVNLGATATSDRWSTIFATNIVANNITLGTSGQNAGNSLTVHGPVNFTKSVSLASGQTVSAPAGTFTTATISSLLDVTGNVDLGSDASDTVSVKGVVDTNIIPSGTRELGSSSAPWEILYVNDLDISDDLVVDDALSCLLYTSDAADEP